MANGIDNLGMVVGTFIAIIVGIIFLGVIANNVIDNTELSTANESVTNSGGNAELANDVVTSLASFGNSSASTALADLAVGTDVNFTANGTLRIATSKNITSLNPTNGTIVFANGPYNAVYSFEGANFVTNSTARTLLRLVILFFVLGVAFIGVEMFRKMFPDLF